MPLYRVFTEPGLLDEPARKAYAADVTRIHCELTGAPPDFVHVLHAESDDGRLGDARANVFGTIRAGRTDQQKADIVEQLGEALADRAGIDASAVSVSTMDVEASWTMEGGRLLPEPGDEGAWKAEGEA
ncbi:MAG: tautomerase family protein [Actinomycetota bacterium]